MFLLRTYQKEWINQIYLAWTAGKRRVLAQLPSCAGKKVACGHLIKNMLTSLPSTSKVLIVVHRLEQLQRMTEIVNTIASQPVGTIQSKNVKEENLLHRIQIATSQTLSNRNISEILPSVGLLIYLDAHNASSETHRDIFECFSDSLILGITSTPKRMDGQSLKELFDELIIGESTASLIKLGYLSKFKLFVSSKPISMKGVKKNSETRDYTQVEMVLAVTQQVDFADVLKLWQQNALHKQTVIFCASVSHSKQIAHYFTTQGIAAEHLDGKQSKSVKNDIITGFNKKKIKVITNYQVLSSGDNELENIECVFCIRPTLSKTLWLQMIGRSLAVTPKKEFALIIDLTENWQLHGLPDEEHKWSLNPTPVSELSNLIGTVTCSECFHVFRPINKTFVNSTLDENGKITEYYTVSCPNCQAPNSFVCHEPKKLTKTFVVKNTPVGKVVEIDLNISPSKLKQVYDFIVYNSVRRSGSQKAYQRIFSEFISQLSSFTLGDWREIVRMVEPANPNYTQRAWELYQDALLRHTNRLKMLTYLERKQISLSNELSINSSTNDSFITDFEQKYRQNWDSTLQQLTSETQEFIKNNIRLFFVERKDNNTIVTLSLLESSFKTGFLQQTLQQSLIEKALSLGFNSEISVIYRLYSDAQ